MRTEVQQLLGLHLLRSVLKPAAAASACFQFLPYHQTPLGFKDFLNSKTFVKFMSCVESFSVVECQV